MAESPTVGWFKKYRAMTPRERREFDRKLDRFHRKLFRRGELGHPRRYRYWRMYRYFIRQAIPRVGFGEAQCKELEEIPKLTKAEIDKIYGKKFPRIVTMPKPLAVGKLTGTLRDHLGLTYMMTVEEALKRAQEARLPGSRWIAPRVIARRRKRVTDVIKGYYRTRRKELGRLLKRVTR